MLKLAQLAELLNGVWQGDANHAIFSYASLARATEEDLSYYDNPLLCPLLESTDAGVVLLKAEDQHLYAGNIIIVAHPLQAMTQAIPLLAAPQNQFSSIHPTAQIHPSVRLAEGVSIGAHTIIEAGVCIGAKSQIAHHVVIHSGSQLGGKCGD